MQNPYSPPGAELTDPKSELPSLAVKGLVTLFRRLVVTSTLIYLLSFAFDWLPIPLPGDLQAAVEVAGTGALAGPVNQYLYWLLHLLWIVSAIGLYFFRPWSRWLFVSAYAVDILSSIVGGVTVLLPWHSIVVTLISLMDGAIIALSFLPPLARVFKGKDSSHLG
jgi:hypothetical protein